MRRGFEFVFRTVKQLNKHIYGGFEQFFVIFGTIEQFIKHNKFIDSGAVEQFFRRGEQQLFNGGKQFFVVFGTVEQFKQLVKFCGIRQYIKRA